MQTVEIDWRLELKLSTLLNAIKQNPGITKLKMANIFCATLSVNIHELNRFAVEHPLIVELILPKYRFKTDDAIKFIGQMKSLRIIEFQVIDHDQLLR